MLEAKLPDTGILYNPSMGRPKSVTETARDVEFIRNSVETMADPAIAKALGWKQWRVLVVRHEHGIPAHTRDGFWTDERRAELKRICIDECKTNVEAAAALGCSPIAVKRKLERLGWTRDPEMLRERRIAVNKEVGYRGRRSAPKPKPVAVAAHAVVAPHPVAPRPFQLQYAPIVFAAPPTESETLGDRILRELSAKPLSCPSLATLLGVNERMVSLQLSFFAHEGRVVAGPVGDRGLRYRVWSVVDQYSSGANSAASLRCGPDSLVVAGEAA